MNEPRFVHIAEHGVLVEFSDVIDDRTTERVQAFDRAIAQNEPYGLLETTPAFVNLLVVFDPLLTDHESIVSALRPLLEECGSESVKGVLHTIDVCYDVEFAQDLRAVSQQTGLAEGAVTAAHADASFKVGMYGFAPGYAYLSGTPKNIQVPRKNSPIRDVAIGSVMIAGPQCLITTLDMPTGWSIIGRTPTTVLRSDNSDKPFLFDIGDTVIFRPINRGRYDELAGSECLG